MDFCRNISVSSGLPSEYQPEQLLSSSCSKLGSLDDLFPSHNMEEGDVSLEWLSIFVEDCFSSSGNCLPPAPKNELQKANNTPTASKPFHSEKTQQNTTTTSHLQKFVIPSKARSKRKRKIGPVPKSKVQVTSWSLDQNLHMISTSSSDPPLLQQAYWLADSELVLPKKDDTSGGSSGSRNSREINRGGEQEEGAGDEEVVEEDENVVVGEEDNTGSLEGSNGHQLQQPRRCTHCLALRTPQWRAGPLGPKTLCNACGVRYKSGRLLPEYRPAKSPTFVSYKHSNSHKKVMEMRMALLSSTIPSHH